MTCLTVPALRDIVVDPGLLQRRELLALGETLDCGDLQTGDGTHRDLTGADGLAIEVHRAGATLGDTAAELGADEIELVTQYPKQRRVIRHPVELEVLAVDMES